MRFYKEGIGIPVEHIEEFERYVADIGGRIGEQAVSASEDAQTIWRLELERAKKLVMEMRGKKDDVRVQTEIDEELGFLVNAAFLYDRRGRRTTQQLRQDLTSEDIKDGLTEYFENTLPVKDELPIGVFVKKSGDKPFLVRGYGNTSPLGIAAVIEAYGIADGHPRSLQDIATRYNTSYTTINIAIRHVIHDGMSQNPQLRQRFLVNP